jgi:hypothetical protein
MSTMAPATQPTLEDVLTHMSAQIAALTREVKELRALKVDVDELRALNDARIVQLEESNQDLVSMSEIPKVVIVQPSTPPQATPKQPPAIGKALTEILKAIQTSNTKEEILQNVLAIIPKILLDC